MFEPTRAHDPNVAQRNLRELLYGTAANVGLDPTSVPHTFQPDPLLDYAERLLSRADVRRETTRYLDLLEKAGIAFAVCRGSDHTALLERGLEESVEPADRGRFLYLIAQYSFFACGSYQEARRYLTAALPLAERFRSLKSHILLLRGRTERLLQDFEGAETTYQYILDSGVIDTRPYALSYFSVLRLKQGRYEEAIRLNREAYDLMVGAGDGFGARSADMDLALVHLAQGNVEAARRLLESVAVRNVEVLDIQSAGRVYNNLAVACERMGDVDAAIRAATDAVHFHTASGRSSLAVGSTINLASYLSTRGAPGASLAALERAIATAAGVQNVELELRALTGAIQVIYDHRIRLDCLASLMDRCASILDTDRSVLSTEALSEFSLTASHVFHLANVDPNAVALGPGAAGLSSEADREELRRVSPEVTPDVFQTMLDRSLGEGLAGRFAPPSHQLRSFLLLYAGDTFRFRHYASEFNLTTTRAKPHLREMCERNVIEIEGTRKAARYALSFHRGQLTRSHEDTLVAPSLVDYSSLG